MIKRFLVICIASLGSGLFAQQGTASPYSFYGIGSLKFRGTVENTSMGGIGVYMDSVHVNLKNPASYVGKNIVAYPYDAESRPVKFAIAGTSTNTTIKTDTDKAKANSSIFDYLAITMPIGKFGVGFGLLPYTSVGYKIDNVNNDNQLINRFNGEGGVNRVYAGIGYQISDKLSAGVDVNYNFGNIQNTALEIAYTPEGIPVQYQNREFNRSDLRGLNLNFGLAYNTKVSEDLELSATATYAPESKLNSDNERTFSTVSLDATTYNITAIWQTADGKLGEQNLDKTKLTLPYQFTIGTGIGKRQSWFVGVEYAAQGSSRFSNPVFTENTTSYEDASQLAIGGFFIPKYNAFSGYFKRVVYRAGFNFGNSGLVVKNESIKQFGISFGAGLPLGGGFSNLNLGFEFGQRGTTKQNLIQENFVNFNLSLSLNDRWFRQRKYN